MDKNIFHSLLFLIAVLASNPAYSTDHYVKCNAASNGNGTLFSPYNSFSSLNLSDNDNIYLWPNVTCTTANGMGPDILLNIGAEVEGITIGLKPGTWFNCNPNNGNNCAILDGGDTSGTDIVLQFLNSNNATVKDLWLRNAEYNVFRYHVNDLSVLSEHSLTMERVRIENAIGPNDNNDAKYEKLTKGTCAMVSVGGKGDKKISVETEDVVVDTCARLGFDQRAWVEGVHHRLKAFRTGTDDSIGGHGITNHALMTRIHDNEWMPTVSGCTENCIWAAYRVEDTDNEQLIGDVITGQPNVKLRRVDDLVLQPEVGTFSIVGPLIVANFGYDPRGDLNDNSDHKPKIIRQTNNYKCFDCEFAYNHIRNNGWLEGNGFQVDDFSTGSCIRCISHNNEGNGYFFNNSVEHYSGHKSSLVSSIAWSNGVAGKCTDNACGRGVTAPGSDVDITNNTVYGSLRDGYSIAGYFEECGLFVNNIALNNGNTTQTGSTPFGIKFQHDAADKCEIEATIAFNNGPDLTQNCAAFVGGTNNCATSTGLQQVDPQLVAPENFAFLPLSVMPCEDGNADESGICYLNRLDEDGCAYNDYTNNAHEPVPAIGALRGTGFNWARNCAQ